MKTGGVRQDGVFIGSGSATTQGFRYQPTSDGEPDYYEMRLLGLDGADPMAGEPLRDGEFKGFLKVEGAQPDIDCKMNGRAEYFLENNDDAEEKIHL